MKKNNEKHHLKALLGVVVLYSLLGFAIYFTISWQNPSFVETLRIVAMFCILILSFETFEQAVLSTVKWKKTLQLFLVIKELVTCFFISLISLLVAAKIMVVIVGDIPLTKNLFNLLISTTFITSLFLYWFYIFINVPKHLDNLYTKLGKTSLSSTMSIKDQLDKKVVLKLIDLFAIFTTVFLLANSTAAGITDTSTPSSIEFFESTEFGLLFIVMAVYVLAAYHKLPLKAHD